MYRKRFITFILTASLMFSLSGCTANESLEKQPELLTLSEIRDQKNNISKEKYANLNLEDTEFYIPDSEEIKGFSVLPYSFSPEEREKMLLDTAQKFSGEEIDENNMLYRPFEGEDMPFSQVKDDPDRDKNYFLYYRTVSLDLGTNILGNYTYGRKTAVEELSGLQFIDNQENPLKIYNLTAEIPKEEIELQDGNEPLDLIVDNIRKFVAEQPFFKTENLTLIPYQAKIYKVGDKNGVNVDFLYEHDDIRIDYHSYGKNLETDEYEGIQCGLSSDASAVWKNSVDDFYGFGKYTLKPSGESFQKFIGLEEALSIMSEKLTGNSDFNVESLELMYALSRVYPDEWYTASDEDKWNIPPTEIKAYPAWIGYIPQTGIGSASRMIFVINAVTGEMKLYG